MIAATAEIRISHRMNACSSTTLSATVASLSETPPTVRPETEREGCRVTGADDGTRSRDPHLRKDTTAGAVLPRTQPQVDAVQRMHQDSSRRPPPAEGPAG